MEKIKGVLLIDDSRAVNNRNESLLVSMDLFGEIHKSISAKEAIDYLKNNSDALPELILLDISMPEVDGFDFLEEYIRLEIVAKTNYSPAIAIVSDYIDADNFTKSKDYKHFGVCDHIKKPIDKDDIISLLEEHLDNYNV